MKIQKKIIILLLIFLGACSSVHYTVKVNSQSISQDEIEKSYTKCKIAYDKNIDSKSIEGREFNNQIIKALEERGISIIEDKNAKCTVEVNYAISGPYSRTETAPVWGQTGVSGSTSYTTGNASIIGNSAYGSSYTTTNYTPQYGVKGYRSYEVQYVVRWLTMRATNKDGEELWKTELYSPGSTTDFRAIFPLLSCSATWALLNNFNTTWDFTTRDMKKIYDGKCSEIKF